MVAISQASTLSSVASPPYDTNDILGSSAGVLGSKGSREVSPR